MASNYWNSGGQNQGYFPQQQRQPQYGGYGGSQQPRPQQPQSGGYGGYGGSGFGQQAGYTGAGNTQRNSPQGGYGQNSPYAMSRPGTSNRPYSWQGTTPQRSNISTTPGGYAGQQTGYGQPQRPAQSAQNPWNQTRGQQGGYAQQQQPAYSPTPPQAQYGQQQRPQYGQTGGYGTKGGGYFGGGQQGWYAQQPSYGGYGGGAAGAPGEQRPHGGITVGAGGGYPAKELPTRGNPMPMPPYGGYGSGTQGAPLYPEGGGRGQQPSSSVGGGGTSASAAPLAAMPAQATSSASSPASSPATNSLQAPATSLVPGDPGYSGPGPSGDDSSLGMGGAATTATPSTSLVPGDLGYSGPGPSGDDSSLGMSGAGSVAAPPTTPVQARAAAASTATAGGSTDPAITNFASVYGDPPPPPAGQTGSYYPQPGPSGGEPSDYWTWKPGDTGGWTASGGGATTPAVTQPATSQPVSQPPVQTSAAPAQTTPANSSKWASAIQANGGPPPVPAGQAGKGSYYPIPGPSGGTPEDYWEWKSGDMGGYTPGTSTTQPPASSTPVQTSAVPTSSAPATGPASPTLEAGWGWGMDSGTGQMVRIDPNGNFRFEMGQVPVPAGYSFVPDSQGQQKLTKTGAAPAETVPDGRVQVKLPSGQYTIVGAGSVPAGATVVAKAGQPYANATGTPPVTTPPATSTPVATTPPPTSRPVITSPPPGTTPPPTVPVATPPATSAPPTGQTIPAGYQQVRLSSGEIKIMSASAALPAGATVLARAGQPMQTGQASVSAQAPIQGWEPAAQTQANQYMSSLGLPQADIDLIMKNFTATQLEALLGGSVAGGTAYGSGPRERWGPGDYGYDPYNGYPAGPSGFDGIYSDPYQQDQSPDQRLGYDPYNGYPAGPSGFDGVYNDPYSQYQDPYAMQYQQPAQPSYQQGYFNDPYNGYPAGPSGFSGIYSDPYGGSYQQQQAYAPPQGNQPYYAPGGQYDTSQYEPHRVFTR